MAKKIIEEDFPDEEEENFDEESSFEEEEDEVLPPIKPARKNVQEQARPIPVERTSKFAPQQRQAPENRFVAVHSPAVDGIMDRLTNKLITTDIMEILARIESRLERIEERVG